MSRGFLSIDSGATRAWVEEQIQSTQADYDTLSEGGVTTLHKHDIVEDTSPQLGGDLDGQGNYLTDVQNIPDLVAGRGAGYWFDRVDDYVSVADDVNLNMGLNDFSLIVTARIDNASEPCIIVGKISSGVGSKGYMLRVESTGELTLLMDDDTTLIFESTTQTIDDGMVNVVGVTVDRDAYGQLYINGGVSSDAFDVSTSNLTIDNSYPFTVGILAGNLTSNPLSGDVYNVKLFNLALTESEVKAFSSGAPIPYKYIGASQDNLLSGWDFTSGWSAAGGGAITDANTITNVVSAGGAIQSSQILTMGKQYRINFAGTTTSSEVKLYTGTSGEQTLLTISATGAFDETLETVIDAVGSGLYIRNDGIGVTDITTFKITQIGCVLDLSPDGIGHNTWTDISSNNLHGQVSGALPINIPANHTEKFIATITGDTSFTLPAGYMIESITTTETAGNALTGGMDIGVTSGGAEIVSAHAVAASTTAICELVTGGNYNTTGADDMIYITDTSGSGWNSASVEITVTMKRVEV